MAFGDIRDLTTAGIQAEADRTQSLIDRRTQELINEQKARYESRLSAEQFGRESQFQAEQARLGREHQSNLLSEDFRRKSEFVSPFLGELGGLDTLNERQLDEGEGLGGPGEAERILIQAQEEAGGREVNRLQDILSDAGILSSGTLAVGTGEIIGRTRGQIAQSLATAAENRLTRRHQELLQKKEQLLGLIQSVLR